MDFAAGRFVAGLAAAGFAAGVAGRLVGRLIGRFGARALGRLPLRLATVALRFVALRRADRVARAGRRRGLPRPDRALGACRVGRFLPAMSFASVVPRLTSIP
jgi:hypothetical protein